MGLEIGPNSVQAHWTNLCHTSKIKEQNLRNCILQVPRNRRKGFFLTSPVEPSPLSMMDVRVREGWLNLLESLRLKSDGFPELAIVIDRCRKCRKILLFLSVCRQAKKAIDTSDRLLIGFPKRKKKREPFNNNFFQRAFVDDDTNQKVAPLNLGGAITSIYT